MTWRIRVTPVVLHHMWYCTTRGTLSTPLHRAPNLLHHTCDMTHLWYFNYSCDMTHSWYSISSITQSSKSTSPRVWHDSFVVLYVLHHTGLLSQIEYLSSTISPPSPSPYRDPNLLHHTCDMTYSWYFIYSCDMTHSWYSIYSCDMTHINKSCYGVATISRHLQIIGLFYKRAL